MQGRTRAAVGLSLWMLFAVPSVAMAQDESVSRAQQPRWVPGLSVEVGLLSQSSEGTASSSEFPTASDNRLFLLPELRFGGELMTPAMSRLPGSPRLFARAALSVAFDGERFLTKEGDPPGLVIPPGAPSLTLVRGTGHATLTEVHPLVVSGGLGIAWEFEALERTFRVKPSIEYRRIQVDVTAQLSAAATLSGGADCPCRSIVLIAREDDSYHALGPGIEFEMDIGRSGPLLLSLFAAGAAYHSLGNERTVVAAAGTFDDVTATPANVSSTVDRDSWGYRAGIGFRLWWSPE